MLVLLAFLTAVFALGSFGGALWLWLGIDPNDPLFEQGGVKYVGPNQRTPVRDLVLAQRRPAMVIAISTGLQFVVATAAAIVMAASTGAA